MLLVGPAAPDRAGILAAVARVDRDGDAARGIAAGGRALARPRLRRGRFRPRSFRVEQRHQRVGRRRGNQVEDEAVSELGDRLQRERLRDHLVLQVEHEAQHGR